MVDWNYADKGPDFWKAEISACAGKEQSPINIEKFKTKYLSELKPIVVKNYNETYTWNVTNNGLVGKF